MSTKSENLAYFADGHTESITRFEISKDFKDIWFTVESGRWFVYKTELMFNDHIINPYPEHKFYEVQFDRIQDDEFGVVKDVVHYNDTDEIKKIKICAVE